MNTAEMLTLAAITYRGCEFNLSNPCSRKIVCDEITRCLNTFSAVQSKWELAWDQQVIAPGLRAPISRRCMPFAASVRPRLPISQS